MSGDWSSDVCSSDLPVNSPGRRDAERNPGEVAEGDDHDEDAGHGEHHASGLRAREAFMEKENTAGNGDERREESADAELHNVTAQNGDHVYPPVETGEARGGREQKGCDRGGENRLDVGSGGAEFSADRHHERDEEKRPENAMGNHLHGADRKSTRLNSSHRSLSRMPSSA